MSLLFVGHPNERDLALFAGGELGPLVRWRIEKHLQDCPRCGEIVADFFHLQGELEDLAKLPLVNWSVQAHIILERAEKQSAASVERGFSGLFTRPLALRTGLIMAAVLCAVVVIRQFPKLDKNNPLEVAMVAENPVTKQFVVPSGELGQVKVDDTEAPQMLGMSVPTKTVVLFDSSKANSNIADSNMTEAKEKFQVAPLAMRERDKTGAVSEKLRTDQQVGQQVVLATDVAAPDIVPQAASPLVTMASIIVHSRKLEEALMLSSHLGRHLRELPEGVFIKGPAAAPVVKLRREYRYQFLLRARDPKLLSRVLRKARAFASDNEWPATALVIDVDPIGRQH